MKQPIISLFLRLSQFKLLPVSHRYGTVVHAFMQAMIVGIRHLILWYLDDFKLHFRLWCHPKRGTQFERKLLAKSIIVVASGTDWKLARSNVWPIEHAGLRSRSTSSYLGNLISLSFVYFTSPAMSSEIRPGRAQHPRSITLMLRRVCSCIL